MSQHPGGCYLSVVVTTRNDSHGGDPIARLQAFIEGFDAQARRTGLDAEVIIVEWNPPANRPRLADVVAWPADPACTYRVIEVPAHLHRTLAHSDALPLFQMIGKNVGIRRARGQFVLATNIDILFSNELVDLIARRELDAGRLYRVDRCDVESQLPDDASLDGRLAYCRSHQLRVNARWGTYPVDSTGRMRPEADDIVDGRDVALIDGWHVREHDVTGCFRWAMASARLGLHLDPAAAAPNVLELEVEANPLDAGASANVEAADEAGRVLGRFHVGPRAVYRLPLPVVPREMSLRTTTKAADSSRSHGLFERRRSLACAVRAIRLRRLDDIVAEPHEYSSALWQPAADAARLWSEGRAGVIDVEAPAGGYAAKYGPLRAPSGGRHRFVVECDDPRLAFGALSEDGQRWLSANRSDVCAQDRHGMSLAVDLDEGESFWLVLSTAPGETGVRRFAIRHLSGSVPATVGSAAAAGSPNADREENADASLRRTPGRVGQVSSRVVDGIIHRAPARVGRLVDEARHGAVLGSPEYQSIRDAHETLRAAYDAQGKSLQRMQGELAALAPLAELRDVYALFRNHPPPDLHLNACGDFQLMARQNWFDLRAYPEVESYSMSLDGLLGTMASYAGVVECELAAPCRIYHLEHEGGSGWTPEGETLLRRRLNAAGIPWIDARVVSELGAYMAMLGRPMVLNGADWGFADHELPETTRGA